MKIPAFSHGYIYVIGGLSESGEPMKSFERYCIESNRWEELKDMKHNRSKFRVASFSDRILIGMIKSLRSTLKGI